MNPQSKIHQGKIALVSVWNHNYGSLLQTYAMQQYLNNKKIKNEIICFQEANLLRKLLRFTNFNYTKVKIDFVYRNIKIKYFHKSIYQHLILRANKFEEFKNKCLQFSVPIYNRKTLIKTIEKNYTTALLGSDQVLHPSNLLMDYFNLNFVPSKILKIGYAPSFGVSKIPWLQKIRTASYLNRFDYMSVREESGQKIVKNLINKDIPIVCDPTLLVEKQIWMDLIKDTPDIFTGNYIFCYFLGNNPSHREFANNLKRLTGYNIIALKYLDKFVRDDMHFADCYPFNVGPIEFIKLISNASFVLTDSFHASIFSIIFEKKFFTFNRFSSKGIGSTNSRISNLLDNLELTDRLATDSQVTTDLLNKEIDYKSVESKIKSTRDLSEKFIVNALMQTFTL